MVLISSAFPPVQATSTLMLSIRYALLALLPACSVTLLLDAFRALLGFICSLILVWRTALVVITSMDWIVLHAYLLVRPVVPTLPASHAWLTITLNKIRPFASINALLLHTLSKRQTVTCNACHALLPACNVMIAIPAEPVILTRFCPIFKALLVRQPAQMDTTQWIILLLANGAAGDVWPAVAQEYAHSAQTVISMVEFAKLNALWDTTAALVFLVRLASLLATTASMLLIANSAFRDTSFILRIASKHVQPTNGPFFPSAFATKHAVLFTSKFLQIAPVWHHVQLTTILLATVLISVLIT